MINSSNYDSFVFQRYNNGYYNDIHALGQQASELSNRGLQYVLRGFKPLNNDGVIIACNPTPEQVIDYINITNYSSYWLEIARPLGGKIKVKRVSL